MPNNGGKKVLNELEFEHMISQMKDRDLLELVAWQNFNTSIRCYTQDARIVSLEKGARKISTIAGGVAGIITAVITGIINYFVTKG